MPLYNPPDLSLHVLSKPGEAFALSGSCSKSGTACVMSCYIFFQDAYWKKVMKWSYQKVPIRCSKGIIIPLGWQLTFRFVISFNHNDYV